jgi:hypothetical protein
LTTRSGVGNAVHCLRMTVDEKRPQVLYAHATWRQWISRSLGPHGARAGKVRPHGFFGVVHVMHRTITKTTNI